MISGAGRRGPFKALVKIRACALASISIWAKELGFERRKSWTERWFSSCLKVTAGLGLLKWRCAWNWMHSTVHVTRWAPPISIQIVLASKLLSFEIRQIHFHQRNYLADRKPGVSFMSMLSVIFRWWSRFQIFVINQRRCDRVILWRELVSNVRPAFNRQADPFIHTRAVLTTLSGYVLVGLRDVFNN